MIQWVIKYSGGLIQDRKQTVFVLFLFATAAILLSLFLLFDGKEGDVPFQPEDYPRGLVEPEDT